MRIATIKVKGEDGGSVLINECDFDPEVHEKHEENGEQKTPDKMSVAELKEALNELGVEIPEGAKKPDLVELLNAQILEK